MEKVLGAQLDSVWAGMGIQDRFTVAKAIARYLKPGHHVHPNSLGVYITLRICMVIIRVLCRPIFMVLRYVNPGLPSVHPQDGSLAMTKG